LAGGAVVKNYIAELRRSAKAIEAENEPAFGAAGQGLGETVDALERATDWLLTRQRNDPDTALAGATPYLRLFATAAGGALLTEEALAAQKLRADAPARIAIARFFVENIAVQAVGLERAVTEGADSVNRSDAALA
jgi:hypothetical protein